MHGVVCLCMDLLFVCEMAVGNIYVVCLLYVCALVRRCIGRVVGVCGGAGRACDCIVRVSHVDDGRS